MPKTVPDYAAYRSSPGEQARIADLLRLLPRERRSILEIGARDGYISRLLAERFAQVTALDLERPDIREPGISCVAGDVRKLEFSDRHFDVTLCSEVLEHIPRANLASACAELIRVTRHELLIGVPFRQDTRIGRTKCGNCGKINPPWGHVNTFSQERLAALFRPFAPRSISLVGTTREVTNPVSVFLHSLAGDPLGTYSQEECCLSCNQPLQRPGSLSPFQNLCCGTALRLTQWQSAIRGARPAWIHILFGR